MHKIDIVQGLEKVSTIVYNINMNKIVFFEIRGRIPFFEFLDKLDNANRAKVRKHIDRMIMGYYGDYKILSPNLYEMRLFWGAGYRIYYTIQKGKIVVLLCAGNKKTQKKDVATAQKYLAIIEGGQNDK